MIRLLLTSDLHLGYPSDPFPVTDGHRLKTLDTIVKLMDDHDILLIGGDLFHGAPADDGLYQSVQERLGRLIAAGKTVLFTPGEGETLPDLRFPSCIHTLKVSHSFLEGNGTPFHLVMNGQEIYVYGVPATLDPYHSAKRVCDGGFHLGLLHTEFDLKKEETAASLLTRRDIESLNYDFFALGHNHTFRLYKYNNSILGVHPGSPEPLSYEETGDRYAVSLTIANDEIAKIKRQSVNTCRAASLSLNCEESGSEGRFYRELESNAGESCLLRYGLYGKRTFLIDRERVGEYAKKSLSLLLVDRSRPSIDILIGQFEREDSLRGEFFHILKDEFASNSLPAGIDREFLNGLLLDLVTDEKPAPEEPPC